MKKTKINFCVVAYGQDGRVKNVIEMTDEEYMELERAMQWPEDLAKYDRLNRPISGAEIGSPI